MTCRLLRRPQLKCSTQLWDRRVIKARKAQAFKGLPVRKAPPAVKAFKVHRAIKATKEQLALRAHKVHKAHRAIKATKDSKDQRTLSLHQQRHQTKKCFGLTRQQLEAELKDRKV